MIHVIKRICFLLIGNFLFILTCCHIPDNLIDPYYREKYTYQVAESLLFMVRTHKNINGKYPLAPTDFDFQQDTILLCYKLYGFEAKSDKSKYTLLFCDTWKEPFNVYINTNNLRTMIIGGVNLTNDVAIWSNGRNKINDYGGGDDINSWQSLMENIKRIKKYRKQHSKTK